MSTVFWLSYVLLWLLAGFQGLVLLGLTRAAYRAPAKPPLDELMRAFATARQVATAADDPQTHGNNTITEKEHDNVTEPS